MVESGIEPARAPVARVPIKRIISCPNSSVALRSGRSPVHRSGSFAGQKSAKRRPRLYFQRSGSLIIRTDPDKLKVVSENEAEIHTEKIQHEMLLQAEQLDWSIWEKLYDELSRKQDLRELKMLQKLENKQYQDLVYKAQASREAQERKFEQEMMVLIRSYETDMDTLTRTQKLQVEKAETNQTNDMKAAAKRIKADQERELRMFKDSQRQEMKLLKQELDLLPKDHRKETFRKKKEEKEIALCDKERVFLESQKDMMDKHMKQLSDSHRQKIAFLEGQFLQQKQQLLRSRESAIWDLEKQQLHEKHQLAKGQLKDLFFLKRHQMLNRHQKEMGHMKRINMGKEEEMQRRHTEEKRRLPRILKAEAKTRHQMFKQSLRLSTLGSPDEDKNKIKQFEENEKRRMKSEALRQDTKHKRQWEDLLLQNNTSVRELEQLQAEKRKMLMEQETQKIRELDEQYSLELHDWKAQLQPRKQKLEDEFARQKEEQERFYGHIPGSGEKNITPTNVRKDSVQSRHSTVI